MDLSTALQLVETAILTVGLGFGLVQLRALRRQQEVQGGAELLRSLQSPQTARASIIVYELPDGLSEQGLKEKLGPDLEAVIGLMAMFESLGPLVARGHIPLDIYTDYYRGVTAMSWRKLRPLAEAKRLEGWTTLWEWFQWLGELMERTAPLQAGDPAHVRLRGWRSPSDYRSIKPTG
jgi:hypothetical protein